MTPAKPGPARAGQLIATYLARRPEHEWTVGTDRESLGSVARHPMVIAANGAIRAVEVHRIEPIHGRLLTIDAVRVSVHGCADMLVVTSPRQPTEIERRYYYASGGADAVELPMRAGMEAA